MSGFRNSLSQITKTYQTNLRPSALSAVHLYGSTCRICRLVWEWLPDPLRDFLLWGWTVPPAARACGRAELTSLPNTWLFWQSSHTAINFIWREYHRGGGPIIVRSWSQGMPLLFWCGRNYAIALRWDLPTSQFGIRRTPLGNGI